MTAAHSNRCVLLCMTAQLCVYGSATVCVCVAVCVCCCVYVAVWLWLMQHLSIREQVPSVRVTQDTGGSSTAQDLLYNASDAPSDLGSHASGSHTSGPVAASPPSVRVTQPSGGSVTADHPLLPPHHRLPTPRAPSHVVVSQPSGGVSNAGGVIYGTSSGAGQTEARSGSDDGGGSAAAGHSRRRAITDDREGGDARAALYGAPATPPRAVDAAPADGPAAAGATTAERRLHQQRSSRRVVAPSGGIDVAGAVVDGSAPLPPLHTGIAVRPGAGERSDSGRVLLQGEGGGEAGTAHTGIRVSQPSGGVDRAQLAMYACMCVCVCGCVAVCVAAWRCVWLRGGVCMPVHSTARLTVCTARLARSQGTPMAADNVDGEDTRQHTVAHSGLRVTHQPGGGGDVAKRLLCVPLRRAPAASHPTRPLTALGMAAVVCRYEATEGDGERDNTSTSVSTSVRIVARDARRSTSQLLIYGVGRPWDAEYDPATRHGLAPAAVLSANAAWLPAPPLTSGTAAAAAAPADAPTAAVAAGEVARGEEKGEEGGPSSTPTVTVPAAVGDSGVFAPLPGEDVAVFAKPVPRGAAPFSLSMELDRVVAFLDKDKDGASGSRDEVLTLDLAIQQGMVASMLGQVGTPGVKLCHAVAGGVAEGGCVVWWDTWCHRLASSTQRLQSCCLDG